MVQRDSISGVFAIVRQVIGDRVIELDFAFLNQLHDEHAAELLAYRSQSKLCVGGIGDVPFTVRHAKGFLINDLALVGHEHRARKQTCVGCGLAQFAQGFRLVRTDLVVPLGKGSFDSAGVDSCASAGCTKIMLIKINIERVEFDIADLAAFAKRLRTHCPSPIVRV